MKQQLPTRMNYAPVVQPAHLATQHLITTADQMKLSSDLARYAMAEMSQNVETAQVFVANALLHTYAVLEQTPPVGRSQQLMEALLFDLGQRLAEITDQANAEIVRLSRISPPPYRG